MFQRFVTRRLPSLPTRPGPGRGRPGLALEALEARDLPTVTLVGTQLRIVGGAGRDDVAVSVRTLNRQAVVSVRVNDRYEANVPVGQVQTILFQGNGGNDRYRFLDATAIPCWLYGGTGNDDLSGGRGNDQIWGESGNDEIRADAGNDRIDGGIGDDEVHGNDGSDTVRGGGDNDHVYGESGDDTLYGDDGSDTLAGGTGSDVLYGGGGNDVLYGADTSPINRRRDGSRDYLYGGTGADTFVVSSEAGLDLARDYNSREGDRLT